MATSNKERIFFGSLEKQERERIEKGDKTDGPASVPSPPQGELLAFSAKALESQEKHQQLLQKLEQSRRARQIAVPTNDEEVKAKLRELKEPIILFGEKPEDRRTRLRELLAKLDIPEGVTTIKEHRRKAEEKEEVEAYLTEGVPELRAARLWIAEYSINRAKSRIAGAKRKREVNPEQPTTVGGLKADFTNFTNSSSEIGDERPLTDITFAPNSQMLVTGGWSGLCKIWDISTSSTCRQYGVLRGHTERIHKVAFHPRATLDLSPSVANLATAASDCTVKLWPLASSSSSSSSSSFSSSTDSMEVDQGTSSHNNNNNNNNNSNNNNSNNNSQLSLTPLLTLSGHNDRVNSVAFHPSGRFLCSASGDKTWRLWDVEKGISLLTQEGHSRALHGLAVQGDGSLVATGGDDAIIRIWDIRSGKTVCIFQGHVKQIIDLDFSPNGFQLVSGSDDHTARVWDLRKKKTAQILAAHSLLISTVKYQSGGEYILTSSFDKTCKLWDTTDWTPHKVLAGHEGRVMGADISPNSKYIASACYDRTWKLWCDETVINSDVA